MILKSACSNNPSYIDRLISVFMRSLQKMVREHLNPQAAAGSTEATAGGDWAPHTTDRPTLEWCKLWLSANVNMGSCTAQWFMGGVL